MMDEGGYLQECGAGEEESPGMAVTEDHQTSDQNHEDQQDVAFSDNEDSIAEIVDTQDALKMLNSQMNLRQENAVLVSENTALYCHIQSLRQTVNELEDAHAASEEMEMTNIISQLKQENESLKVRCENITSEMYSVLYEGKMKTKKILDNLIDLQWAQQQQLEEKHQLALDKKSQDIHEKSMMIEELLATIQELRTNNQEPRLDIQTKSWWRRQRDKVVKGMATFRRCFKFSVGVRTSKRSFNRCNKVHPVNIDVV